MRPLSVAATLALALHGAAVAATLNIRIEGVDAVVVEGPFDPSAQRFDGCPAGAGYCYFDGKRAAGAHGMPAMALRRFAVTVDGKTYELDTSNMFNPHLPTADQDWTEAFGGFCYDRDNCGFRAVLGSGAVSYAAEWIINAGVPYRSVLTDSMDVVQHFRRNLSPPRYR